MITLVRIQEAVVNAGKRILKARVFGKNDIRTATEVMPYGVDSQPIDNAQAIYTCTTAQGVNMIIGYVNTKQQAAKGEFRTYSTDATGNVMAYTWLKNNGDLLLNGSDDNAVRYSELEKAFNKLKSDHNTLAQKWDAFCTAYVPGSPTTTGSPATLSTSTVGTSSADITPAKIAKIKVPKADS